jgi:hypothetical protein
LPAGREHTRKAIAQAAMNIENIRHPLVYKAGQLWCSVLPYQAFRMPQ